MKSTDLRKTTNDVVFFDERCLLCNQTVQFLIKIDVKKRLKFSPLQGQLAKQILTEAQLQSKASVILWSDGHFRERVDALTHILFKVGGPYKGMGWMIQALPLFVSNQIYDLIARNRYRIFGKVESCLISEKMAKERLIP